jgi:hypothetical protein
MLMICRRRLRAFRLWVRFFFGEILDVLCGLSEQDFRDMGFGYRAKYMHETCKEISERGGLEYLVG